MNFDYLRECPSLQKVPVPAFYCGFQGAIDYERKT